MKPLLVLKSRKLKVVVEIVVEKLFKSKLPNFEDIVYLFKDKTGLEIGGPSSIFLKSGSLPIYSLARVVDGCNFSTNTVWEGEISEGSNYISSTGKQGYQYICDGVDVPVIPKKKYDFVLSCNNLEHIANPLKAISNWLTLLKNKGTIVLVLPRRETNFDHKRPVTSFQHLLDDFNNDIGEDDLTHLDEILQLHDLKLDPLAGNFESFRKRSENNFDNRCLHHHVFDQSLLREICEHFNLKIISQEIRSIDHIIIATI